MNPKIYNLSLMAGVVLVGAGVALINVAAALITVGVIVLALTIFGATLAARKP